MIRRTSVIVLTALLSLTRLAQGGQSQDASMIGQVTDESGAAMPGVTVTASSSALQVQSVTVTTDGRGEYRLAPLPIGIYQVEYSLSGFSIVRREGIQLTAGFVAKVDVSLKVGGLSENVTVIGASPLVDVTSTATTAHLTKETLELIPSTRNGVLSLMNLAPGVRGNLDVGGSNFSAVPTLHAYGQDAEQWSILEGVLTAPPIGQPFAFNYWDFSSFEETRVGAVGKTVEVPVRGVQLDAIVKSGSNDYHGGLFFSGSGGKFQSKNLDDKLRSQGITSGNPLDSQWDGSGELGGRVVRNSLWFYGSTRKRVLWEDYLNAFKPDGTPATHYQAQRFGTGKVSYQTNAQNRFIFFHSFGSKEEVSGVSSLIAWESRVRAYLPTSTSKIEWQAVKGNVVASAQIGRWHGNADYYANTNNPSITDQALLTTTGVGSNGDRIYYRDNRYHSTGSLTWYQPDLLLGNHQIKAGFDYMDDWGILGQHARSQGDYQIVLQRAAAFQIQVFNSPNDPQQRAHYLAEYVSDNWAPTRRLTLSLGARFAHDNAFAPAQCRAQGVFNAAGCIDPIQFRVWNSIAPRVSVAYDLTGSGTTAIKGGWGRFAHRRLLNEVAAANPYANTTTTYRWHDNNGDKLYQTGEVNLDPNGPDYVTQTGAANAVPDSNEQQPATDQTFVSFEREIIRDLSLRATGFYARYFNVPRRVRLLRPYDAYNIAITRPDPGPDGNVGTADDPGTTLTYWDYSAAYSGSRFELNTQTSPPGQQDLTFKTIEVAANKRLSKGWHLMASMSATKKNQPVPDGSPAGGTAAFLDPNAEYNVSDNTWEWIGRISGSFLLPYQVTFGANMENRSGTTQTRSVLLTGGAQTPSLVVNAAPIGSLRLPTIHDLDLRLEKNFKLMNRQRLAARLNIYNTLNANTITAWTTRAGANFKIPTAILPARIYEVAVTYTF